MTKILVVEDDADLVETYVDLLESKGFTVFSASRASEAVELAAHWCPSIVILDLSLPGGSGMGVLDFVRSQKLLKETKVIVVTGHSEMTDATAVEKADILLSKPVSNDQLLRMIVRLLSLSETRISRSHVIPDVNVSDPKPNV